MDKVVGSLGRNVFCLCGMPIDILDLAQALPARTAHRAD